MSQQVLSRATKAKITVAAGFGGLIEYFDLVIAAYTAASIWPIVFFPGNVADALGISIGAVAVTFLARPVGAFIFGHVGDKLGRRNTLVYTLILLGGSTLGIGLVPGYTSIGYSAIALLFFFRITFGLGMGGEFGGAVSWIVEVASDSKKRSFWAVWAAPATFGLVLAGVVFTAMSAALGHNMQTYGWRIPFIVGSLMTVVGLVIRYRLTDSPMFRAIKEKGQLARAPAIAALRRFWKPILMMGLMDAVQITLATGVQAPFSIGYLAIHHISPTFTSFSITFSNAIGMITWIIGPFMSEKFGRKRTLLVCNGIFVVAMAAFFPLINTLNLTLIVLAQTLISATIGLSNAGIQTLMAESFPTKYRYSGAGISYQIAALIAGIVTTIVASATSAVGTLSATPYIAAIVMIVIVAAIVANIMIKDTKGVDLHQLDAVETPVAQ
ncbi:MAG: MFS transporter [Nitrososphaerota archaeon]|nr:MFS transporter [Nitrososphaerota archaeon]MDG6923451.1 MFS transporter [Nitrososphaerota archaeon]